MTEALLGLAAAFGLIFARVPVAVALMAIGFCGLYWFAGERPAMASLALTFRDSTMVYTLSVVPLFVLMGNIVGRSGLAAELYDASRAVVGRYRGGLALATILSCGGFAAVSGSSVATAATMSTIAVPAMRGHGYADRLSAGTVAAGGTLGILIPPSVIMVIYGIATETHIGELFAAGLLPGLLGILGYMAAILCVTRLDPKVAPAGEAMPKAERRRALRKVWAPLLLFVIVIGGIYGGMFTPTEAAGVGAAGSLLVSGLRRQLSWRIVWEATTATARTSTMIFAVLIGATIFAEFLNLSGAHQGILALVDDAALSPAAVIAIILVIYIVLGCVLESLSMMLLTVPLFFPVVIGLGFDPVWFGIIVVVAVEIGLITPPLGLNLFVLRSVLSEVRLATLYRGVAPFVIADVVRIVLLSLFPAISLLVPELLFR